MSHAKSQRAIFFTGAIDITEASQPTREHLMEEFAAQGRSGLQRTQ